MRLSRVMFAMSLVAGVVAFFAVTRVCGEPSSSGKQPEQGIHAAYRTLPRSHGLSMTRSPLLFDHAEPHGSLSLSGTVLREDGRVAAAARVAIDSVPVRITATDSTGHFLFDGLAPRSYVVRATSADSWGIKNVRLTRPVEGMSLRLQRGGSVSVDVFDSSGQKPVAGARVTIEDIFTTTSDRGAAVLQPVKPGWAYIDVSAVGHASLRISTMVSTASTTRVAVRMKRGYLVAGVVMDERGMPVPLASIFVHSDRSAPVAGQTPTAITDENGQFRLPEVPAGVHRLFAVDALHAPATSRPLVVENDLLDVGLIMKGGGHLDGRVLDAMGAPVAHAVIQVDTDEAWYSRQTVSGADGRFTLVGLPRTFLRVRAESPLGASKTEVADLSALDSRSLDLLLLRTGTIAGVVVDDEGRAKADVDVSAIFRLNDSVFSSTTSDKSGQFTLDDLPEGEYVLWAGPSGEQYVSTKEVTARTGDTNVILKKTTYGSVRGEVAIRDASSPPNDVVVTLFGTTVGIQRSDRAINTGAFAFDRLPPDSYQLMLRGPQFVESRFTVKVESNQASELGTIVVSSGRAVSGQVTDGMGVPISDAVLRVGEVRRNVATFRQDPWQWRTDATGRFTIAGLLEGASYLLVAATNQACSPGVRVPPASGSAANLVVVLQPCGSLFGTVVEAGKPLSGVLVAVGDPEVEAMLTDESGAFAFVRVPAGRSVIRIVPMDGNAPLFEGDVVVAAGAPTEVTFDIREKRH